MIIISLKATQLFLKKNQLQYKSTLYKMTFNIPFLNISIKFYLIKNLFTGSFSLNLDFYLLLLPVPSDLSKNLSPSVSLCKKGC